MASKVTRLAIVFAALMIGTSAHGVGTTVTYQGRLEQDGVTRNGDCDFTFSLYDAAADGTQIGNTKTLSDVTVTNGTFTVGLDFGAAAFAGPDRWLQVGVRCPAGSGSFVPLDPRQPLTAAPYAILANAVANDAVSSTKILDGTIVTGDLANGAVTDAKVASGISYAKLQGAPSSLPPSGPAGGSLAGTYPNPGIAFNSISSAQIVDGQVGNADLMDGSVTSSKILPAPIHQAVLTSLDAGAGYLAVWVPPTPAWNLAGNANIIQGSQFLGTTDATPFELRVNGQRALRVDPPPAEDAAAVARGSNNIVHGSRLNHADFGFSNQTISGGGVDNADPVDSDYGNFAQGDGATIAGGADNDARGLYATVSGGFRNRAESGAFNTVGGGIANQATGTASVIGGGEENHTGNAWCTIGGGHRNVAGPSGRATVAGGEENSAAAEYATVGGGGSNAATGAYATVPGGLLNEASGMFSFAAGMNAHATHKGSFVWGDGTRRSFSNVDNQFNVTATGGVSFWHDPTSTRHCDLTPNAVGWACTSDRSAKENFVEVDSADVLRRVNAMPITWWNLKGADPSDRHIGPVAQDFHDTFGVGGETTINTMDAQGIAFAAIQGLHRLVQEKDAQIAVLASRVAALERQVRRR